jgi:hypothetical protein
MAWRVIETTNFELNTWETSSILERVFFVLPKPCSVIVKITVYTVQH